MCTHKMYSSILSTIILLKTHSTIYRGAARRGVHHISTFSVWISIFLCTVQYSVQYDTYVCIIYDTYRYVYRYHKKKKIFLIFDFYEENILDFDFM